MATTTQNPYSNIKKALGAVVPLVRRVKDASKEIATKGTLTTTKKTFEPPQFIPGIKHVVEGFSNIKQQERVRLEKGPAPGTYNPDRVDPERMERTRWATDKKFNKKSRQRYDEAVADFKRRQELRMKIPSLPDSEALQLGAQREAARRRMRGYTGTLLSKKEKLGG